MRRWVNEDFNETTKGNEDGYETDGRIHEDEDGGEDC